MAFDQVSVYTQAMNAAFVNSYEAMLDPPDVQKALTIVPSKGRVENFPWLYPPPMMKEWKGYRDYAKLGETNYRVPNKTFSSAFEILAEDLDDDQIDGFKRQAAEMAKAAQAYPFINVQLNLAAGQTTPCFDGSNFFATSHNVGTGNNIVAGTAASGDGITHAMVALIITNRVVKPLLWQMREPASFRSDAGSIESDKVRMVRNWCSLRGAAGFGFWWDSVLIKFTSTPTVADMLTTLGTVNARLRSFTYPKNVSTDPDQWAHGNTKFDASTVLLVCSNLIEHIARQALTLDLISTTTNYFKGWASLSTSGYLNSVV